MIGSKVPKHARGRESLKALRPNELDLPAPSCRGNVGRADTILALV